MTRRKKGTGSIAQKPRADGLWPGHVPLPNGKQKRLYGRTQEELAQKVEAEVRKLAEGRAPPQRDALLSAFLIAWVGRRSATRRGLSPGTRVAYEQLIRLHIVPTLGRRRVSSIRPGDLERLYDDLRAKGLSDSTVHRVHSLLHVALKDAERRGETNRNPCDLIDAPSDSPRPRRPFDTAALVAVLATVEGSEWEALIWLAVECGLRQGELFALRLSDLDLEAGVVDIAEKVRRLPGVGVRRSAPKSEAGNRAMALGGTSVAALRRHIDQLANTDRPNPLGLVFPNRAGGYLEPQNWNRRVWRNILKSAGVDQTIQFRELTRKAHASVAVAVGVDLATLRGRMGHTSSSTTLDHYVKQISEADRRAAESVDRGLRRLVSEGRKGQDKGQVTRSILETGTADQSRSRAPRARRAADS